MTSTLLASWQNRNPLHGNFSQPVRPLPLPLPKLQSSCPFSSSASRRASLRLLLPLTRNIDLLLDPCEAAFFILDFKVVAADSSMSLFKCEFMSTVHGWLGSQSHRGLFGGASKETRSSFSRELWSLIVLLDGVLFHFNNLKSVHGRKSSIFLTVDCFGYYRLSLVWIGGKLNGHELITSVGCGEYTRWYLMTLIVIN